MVRPMKVSKEGLGLIGFAAIGVTAISAQYAPGDVHLPIRAFEDARGGAADYRPIDCLPTPAATGTRSRQEQAIKCAETGEQHRLATNDLIQQTRAADAAAAQTTLAAQSVRLSFVQTLAAFLTLVAAAAAALYARRAATAAKDTFDLDKAVSANVDRPWLSLSITIASDLALVDGKKTTFKVDVNVENIGNQPALNVTTWVEMYRGTKSDNLEEAKLKVEEIVAGMRSRAKLDYRTILPRRQIMVRAPQELEIGFRYRARALAYVKYTVPSGQEVFSWEVFEYEYRDAGGRFVPIISSLAAVKQDDLRARPIGLTHSV